MKSLEPTGDVTPVIRESDLTGHEEQSCPCDRSQAKESESAASST